MKLVTRKTMICALLLVISILIVDSVLHNYFYDEENLVNDYYDAFLNEHGALVPLKYHCNKQKIINEKQYQIKNRDYVTFFCDNGKAIVYRFEKGFGRSVVLSDWKQS